MADDKFALSLQEDLLCLLTHSEQHGKAISKIVQADLFEGDYSVIASKALDFWKQYSAPPKQHIADLLADILEDKKDARSKVYRRIIVQMEEVKDQINADFVMRTMNRFIRMQRFKASTLEGAELIDARGVSGLEEAEAIWQNFLKERTSTLDVGLRLDDIDGVLSYFEKAHNEFKTGIKELDEANIVPMRGKMLLFLAPAKRGKSWFLVQLGKMAFLMRKKVVHISLEIEPEEVAQRYYQALFGASKRDDTNKVSSLKLDKKGNIDQVIGNTIDIPFNFASEAIRDELQARVGHFGTRASNIIIKRFPMRSLTMDHLESYLESLEALEKFTPDLVIVDYPKIMKIDAKNPRMSIGFIMEDLRGMSQRRNFALAVVHQGNRSSMEADMVKATHASEDWSVVCTADFLITYSQTAAEKRRGLARLFVDMARSEVDQIGVLITQSYKTGQFVLESTRLNDSYAALMEAMGTDDEEADDD